MKNHSKRQVSTSLPAVFAGITGETYAAFPCENTSMAAFALL